MKKEIDENRIKKAEKFYAKRIRELGLDAEENDLSEILTGYCARNYFQQNKKGLLLSGGVGTGKTTGLMLLKRFFGINAYSSWTLWKIFRKENTALYDRIQFDEIQIGSTPWDNDLIIDDLGDEPTVNDYGNKFELLGEVILIRYNLFISRGCKTHISTNLDPGQIQERYGERLLSRLYEMCTIIPVMGADRRRAGGA